MGRVGRFLVAAWFAGMCVPAAAAAQRAVPPFQLSCPTSSLCVAADRAGNVITATDAVRWTGRNVDGSRGLVALSCPDRSLCVALDAAGDVLTSTDPAGPRAAWTRVHLGDFDSLACPSARLCVAVGGGGVAVTADPAGRWRIVRGVDRTEGPECGKYGPGQECGAALTSVSCASARLCTALDSWGVTYLSADPISGGWSAVGGGGGGPVLDAVSCPSQSSCVGTCPVGVGLDGAACPGSVYDAGDIVTWDRSDPLAGPETFSTISDAPLTGVWCPRLGLCLAADGAGRLFESGGGASRWRLAASAPRPIAGVACPSPSACVALAEDGDVFVMRGTRFVPAGAITAEPAFDAPAEASGELPAARSPRPAADVTHTVNSSVGYGLATPNNLPQPFASCQVSSVPCPTSGVAHCGPPLGDCLQGFYRSSSHFTALRKGLPLTYARFFIAYDAVDYSSGGECVASPAAAAGVGTQDFDRLVYNVQAARADNLTPVVAFTNGTGTAVPGNPVPAIPDPSYGTAGSAPWAAWTQAGSDYYCGVLGIQLGLMDAGIGSNPVTDWEAWNEPNGATQSNSNGGGYNGSLGPTATYPDGPCGSASYNGVVNDCGGEVDPGGSSYLCYTNDDDCGPTEAGGLWELAQSVADTQFPGDGFTVAALSLSDAQNSVWLGGYSSPLRSAASCAAGYYCSGALPTAVAVHDYDDPSSGVSGAVGDIGQFTSSLASDLGTGLDVWITESAINLNDATQSDRNRAAAVYPSGVWPGCNASFGESDHVASDGDAEFGICVDRQPANQAAGADSFLALAGQDHGETVDQVDWYEFQAPNLSTGWDSGLLSPPTGTYKSPDGAYSRLRKSFCVLAHAIGCSASATDAADWSTQPGGLGQ